MADVLLLEKELTNLLSNTCISVKKDEVVNLVQFVLLIDKWNKAYNLTSVRKVEDMLLKHIVDSVVVSPYLNGNIIVDVGTGPGLPGIPLAILNPSKTFYLVDSQSKRINFVREVRRILGLNNVIPILARCEDFKLPDGQSADCVLSRAFASLKDMLTLCSHFVSDENNGCYLALKSQISTQELEDIPSSFSIAENIELKVPGSLGKRCLIKIKKNNMQQKLA